MILITGASGTVGRAVLEEIRKEHQPFTAMYRSAEEARKAPAGVESVYLVCSPIPQLVELESNVIEACEDIGVRHVVLNSALGAGTYDKSYPAWHTKGEE